MGQDPDTIRQQIAETRAEMDGTIDALGYKADVPARAKENLQGKVDSVTDAATAVKDKIVGRASEAADAAPSATDLKSGVTGTAGDLKAGATEKAQRASSVAQQNPIGLAIGAVAIGFLGGLLVPTTQVEQEKIGPLADKLKDQATEAGQDAIERGKVVAQNLAEAAQEGASQAADGVKEAVAT